MTIESYLLYVIIAMATIASPGPGVILTLMNALRYSLAKSLVGIFGIATGMFAILWHCSLNLSLLGKDSRIQANSCC